MAKTGSFERAVSPVVAVTLMLAITILITVVAASGVFSQLGPYNANEPQVDVGYYYSEEYEETELDSFGLVGLADEHGKARITIESTAETINADQLSIIVDNTEYSWANHNTRFGVRDNVNTGDSIEIWVERGDDILLKWRSEDGESSFILGSYTIPDLMPGNAQIPAPDEDCSWVENQLGPPPYSGDLTIDGIIVECDLDAYDVHKLVIKNGGGVIGEVEADGDIDISDGSTWEGDVEMLSGGNDVDIDDGSDINGDVIANGGVALDAGSRVQGGVFADNDVDVDGNSVIGGGIDTDGNVKLNEQGSGGVTVGDKITAGGDIDVGQDSTVQGDIESDNSGSITVASATVLGDVATQQDVDLDDSTVGQDVFEDNGFSCSNSVISGQSCSSYTTKDYSDY